MGKSTSAQLLGRDHGYVYYEADCFSGLKNPYISLQLDNPTLAQMSQKILKGPGAEERKAMIQRTNLVQSLMSGQELRTELILEFYEHLALDIRREKERIGGDFAIATFILKKEARDHIRKILGSDLIIVNLSMSQEERRERLVTRHHGDTSVADKMDVSLHCPALFLCLSYNQILLKKYLHQLFAAVMEGLEESESQSFTVMVGGNMNKTQVVEQILRKIREIGGQA